MNFSLSKVYGAENLMRYCKVCPKRTGKMNQVVLCESPTHTRPCDDSENTKIRRFSSAPPVNGSSLQVIYQSITRNRIQTQVKVIEPGNYFINVNLPRLNLWQRIKAIWSFE